MVEITMRDAREYFIKLNCDSHTKEELASKLWEEITCNEREEAFRELKELNNE